MDGGVLRRNYCLVGDIPRCQMARSLGAAWWRGGAWRGDPSTGIMGTRVCPVLRHSTGALTGKVEGYLVMEEVESGESPTKRGGPCLGTMLGDEWVLEEGRGGAEFVSGQCSSAVFLFRSSGLHWGRGRRVNHFPLRAGPWTIDQSESGGAPFMTYGHPAV